MFRLQVRLYGLRVLGLRVTTLCVGDLPFICGSGFRVHGSGFRVQGSGFRAFVSGSTPKPQTLKP